MNFFYTIMTNSSETAKELTYQLWNVGEENYVRWERPDGTLVYPEINETSFWSEESNWPTEPHIPSPYRHFTLIESKMI